MKQKLKVFLDSSGLISAVIAVSEAPAIYRLMMLGEANVIDLRISREVIGDVERFVRARNPKILPKVAQVIGRGNIATTLEPDAQTVAVCERITGYLPDARILAAAVGCNADVLVTHDADHLLNNPKIKPPSATVMVKTPGQCLEWCFAQWRT